MRIASTPAAWAIRNAARRHGAGIARPTKLGVKRKASSIPSAEIVCRPARARVKPMLLFIAISEHIIVSSPASSVYAFTLVIETAGALISPVLGCARHDRRGPLCVKRRGKIHSAAARRARCPCVAIAEKSSPSLHVIANRNGAHQAGGRVHESRSFTAANRASSSSLGRCGEGA